MALKKYESFPLLDQYLSYLTVIRGRSKNTITEYRTDILMLLNFINQRKNVNAKAYEPGFVDKEYLSCLCQPVYAQADREADRQQLENGIYLRPEMFCASSECPIVGV